MRPRLCECMFVNFELIHGDVSNDVKLNQPVAGVTVAHLSAGLGTPRCQSRRKWRVRGRSGCLCYDCQEIHSVAQCEEEAASPSRVTCLLDSVSSGPTRTRSEVTP